MTYIELGTFILLAGVTVWGIWRLTRRQKLRELELGRDPRSSTYASAAASTLLGMKIDPLVRAGSIIYMPVGDGLYMHRTTSSKAKAWTRTIRGWLRRGASIHIIVTLPNKAARDAWLPLAKEFPGLLHYCEFDRASASPEMAKEIGRLDTYHPVVLVNGGDESAADFPGAPGAMWIEQYHPLGSAHAYAVQYVAPAEIRTDGRFAKFVALYEKLLGAGHAQAGKGGMAHAA